MTEELIRQAARLFNVAPADVRGSRGPAATAARWAVMYALRYATEMSYSEIGQQLGGRHHTTVIHAVQSAERRACADPDYALALAALRC